jgi:hypothetical protein
MTSSLLTPAFREAVDAAVANVYTDVQEHRDQLLREIGEYVGFAVESWPRDRSLQDWSCGYGCNVDHTQCPPKGAPLGEEVFVWYGLFEGTLKPTRENLARAGFHEDDPENGPLVDLLARGFWERSKCGTHWGGCTWAGAPCIHAAHDAKVAQDEARREAWTEQNLDEYEHLRRRTRSLRIDVETAGLLWPLE